MSQPQAQYQTDLSADRDAQVRLLQKAVDGVKQAHGALRDFMEASACWHWSRKFLDQVCDTQNTIIALRNSKAWDQIEEEAASVTDEPEVEE